MSPIPLYDEDVRDALIAGLENHTAGVVNVRESLDTNDRVITVEMTNGKAYRVDVSIEVYEA